MVSFAGKGRPHRPNPHWHRGFLAMLPVIRNYARGAFAHLNPDLRQDLTQEVIANALVATLDCSGRVGSRWPNRCQTFVAFLWRSGLPTWANGVE